MSGRRGMSERPNGMLRFRALAVNGIVVARRAVARVVAGDILVILESMKMEIAIKAPVDGEVLEMTCVEGRPVAAGDPICVLRPAPAVAHA